MRRILETYSNPLIDACKKHIDEETLSKIVDFDSAINIPKGNLILAENKSYFLLSGIIRGFYLDVDGNDITHMFILENQICGTDFITTDKPHTCNYEVLEDCTALQLNFAFLKECIKSNQALALIYINVLEESMKLKIMRETSLVTKTATERYLDFIKQFPSIEDRVSQIHIASYLGINPVSLSRIRRVIKSS